MLASELITQAWYFSGIVQREGEQPSDTQSADGLTQLNSLLSKFSIDGKGIPYTNHNVITLIAGQESYTVPNLIQIQALTYEIETVRYPLRQDSIYRYFGTSRANNIDSLSYHFYPQRILGGMQLWFYFLPYQDMPLNITGIYALTSVDFSTNLDTLIDDFYQWYLVFKLAKRFCDFYGNELPQGSMTELNDYEKRIEGINPPDLTVRTVGLFDNKNALSWAQVNLGRGWTP